jgi:hypothetical protein
MFGISRVVRTRRTMTVLASFTGYALNGSNAVPLTIAASRVPLPPNSVAVIVANAGPKDAWVRLGNATVSATTADTLIPDGYSVAMTVDANTTLAAMVASGSATIRVYGASRVAHSFNTEFDGEFA